MNTQKIALFGTSDETSQRLITEALKRGHMVTAIVPEERQLQMIHPNLKMVNGDARKKEDVIRYARGNDVVICVYEPTKAKPREYVDITRTVIAGTKDADVQHLLFAAHPLGLPAESTEEFYNSFKSVVKAQKDSLNLVQNEKELYWGYVHSVEPEPGNKAGKYRISSEIIFTHPEGESRITIKNYPSAVIDEAEKGEMELHEHGEEESEY